MYIVCFIKFLYLCSVKIKDEKFIQYIWTQRLYSSEQRTILGECVEIISTGTINRDAGPDVFNAKIKIGDKVWAGNVEFHVRASDWNRHHHTHDSNYENVILHVVLDADEQVIRPSGSYIPTIILHYPEHLNKKFEEMQNRKEVCRCCSDKSIAEVVDPFRLNSWLDRLLIERLESKTEVLNLVLKRSVNNWHQALFVILARGFGFGTNADALQAIAESIPYNIILHHRDNLEQIEALLLGQGGLLDDIILENHSDKTPHTLSQIDKATPKDGLLEGDVASGDEVVSNCVGSRDMEQIKRWVREYEFLKRKYNLKPSSVKLKFLRMRPQGFPTVRIAQLAMLLHKNDHLLSNILENPDTENLYKILSQEASEFWQTHYSLKQKSPKHNCTISRSSVDLLIINSVVPFLFFYGRLQQKEELEERALQVLQSIRGEQNFIVTLFENEGVVCKSAYDSQALIELYRNYCSNKKCLQCVIGYEAMKTK